jgi:hypothetical protein
MLFGIFALRVARCVSQQMNLLETRNSQLGTRNVFLLYYGSTGIMVTGTVELFNTFSVTLPKR